MTLDITKNSRNKGIELNDIFKKNPIPKFNKGMLSSRKFKLISEIFVLINFNDYKQNFFNLVSELILLVLKTPETVFLDKIFFESKTNNEEKEYFRLIPNLVKKFSIVVNHTHMPDKKKIKYLEFIRRLIKIYTKYLIKNR